MLLAICSLQITGNSQIPAIDAAVNAGEFTKAQSLIKEALGMENLSPQAAYDLELQSQILDRIRIDFNRDEAYVRRTLAKYYPQLTDAQLAAWETSGDLEMRRIDGEKRYFRNAVWNLFRVNAEARKQKEAVDGPAKDGLAEYLRDYLPKALQQIKASGKPISNPQTRHLRYTLTVEPNAVPAGEMVRAWLPYPRADRDRQAAVQLEKTSEPHFILSPVDYPHSSIYFEKRAVKDSATVFQYEVTYTAYDEWHDLSPDKVKPYDTHSALYQLFTAERAPHIRFTPALKALSKKIIGDETNPVRKARLLFDWIGNNIPWASALEYSTMPDIPGYCMAHRRGDCGMKALLFITLCRYNDIPAKWQSGWMLYPDHLNLHDWSEIYFEGVGWVPVDPDFNRQQTTDPAADLFFFGGADAWRLIVNDDFSGDFFPAKVHPRSETVDFQRGEVEWRGGNVYFDKWDYEMEVLSGVESLKTRD